MKNQHKVAGISLLVLLGLLFFSGAGVINLSESATTFLGLLMAGVMIWSAILLLKVKKS